MFESGWFKLHSGDISSFKINCDSLTDEDWEAIAKLIAKRFKFSFVYGVATGGSKLANALMKYETVGYPALIVDDVLTTGSSMKEARKKILTTTQYKKCIGVVLFARSKCPRWIVPIFTVDKNWLR